MPTATFDGVGIHYDLEGDGPLIMLSHGYSATGRMWAPTVPALRDSYKVLTWDMRGHGESDSPDEPNSYSESLTVSDMRGLLDAAGAQTAVIGGLSLGGYMSLAFNAAHPERVRALVLCDTGPGYRSDEAREGWNKMARQRADTFEARGLDALGRSSEVEATRRYHRSAQGLAHAARGMLAQVDSRVMDSLPNVAVPTIVIVGEKDTGFIAASEYMAKKIPGARLEVIPDAGHAANIDQPTSFNSVLLDFLDTLK